MANRRIATVDMLEILRLIRAGESNSTIAQVLGCNLVLESHEQTVVNVLRC